MNLRNILFILIPAIFFSMQLMSQSPVETAARAELEKRGLDENRVREELLKRGVDVDKIDPNNRQQVMQYEKVIREVITMLEQEKKNQGQNTVENNRKAAGSVEDKEKRSVDTPEAVARQSTEIQKAVKEGATIEEAVTEKIQESVSQTLPRPMTYGQHIFRDKSIKLFRTAEDAKPPRSYVLGPGDKIAISIWGPSQENFALEIQKDGYIQPSNLPRYYLAGLTIEAARNLMAQKLRNYYFFQNENFELTVTTARTINVNILGEVFTNGSFNISAVNTAFNALIAAGGPNDIGSVRNINVLSAGKKPRILDVYKYLNNPLVSQEFYLSENDYIHVPVAQKVVTLTGAVQRPFRYELLDKENLKDLIGYAAGFKANALKGNIQIKRIEDDMEKIIDVNYLELEKNGGDFALKNGDVITVKEINVIASNYIIATGAVQNPGTFALKEGERISDLIRKAVLLENAITDIAYLKRLDNNMKTVRYNFINLTEIIKNPGSEQDWILKKGDELVVEASSTFADKFTATVEGAVRNPKEIVLDADKNIRVSDLIFIAGGLREDAMDFAYIFRKNNKDAKTQEYIFVDLKAVLSNTGSNANYEIQPLDRLVVYSRNNYLDESFIKVDGAVRAPGEFLYNESLTIKDALLLAGGLRREASLDRIDVYRLEFGEEKSTRVLVANVRLDEQLNIKGGSGNFQLEPFDQIYVRFAPNFETQRNINLTGEVKYPGTYALFGDNTKLATIIGEAGGLTNESFPEGATLFRNKDNVGFIIIDLKEAMKNPRSFANIILQDGDEIFIPKQNNIVSITGATKAAEVYPERILVQNKINVNYIKGKDARFYIDNFAGGVAKEGSPDKITVTDASGKVRRTKRFLFFRNYPEVGPGSVIQVGYKDKKSEESETVKKEGEVKWGEVLASSIAQATAILSIILLIQNVN